MDKALHPTITRTYTIQEVSERSGLSIPTLRYYEEMGLIPRVTRDESSKHRRYDERTMQLVETLANLRRVGMSMSEMRTYLSLRGEDDVSAAEKRDLFKKHAEIVSKEIAKLQARNRYLTMKVAYWDARVNGDLSLADKIAEEYEDIIAEIRRQE